uniref:Ciliary associated calcium binding coiled-coil 1 n=1 Tax=Chelydra serpentina TaxID=8475 RepID=A0A8C3XPK9_CHESE
MQLISKDLEDCDKFQMDLNIKLEEFLNFRQIKTSLTEAVLLDYYVSGFWWAKEMDFTHLQLSGFMAILNFLLENLSTKHMTLEDNIKELGRAMAGIGESHSEKSGGLDFFSVDQAKAIISYLKIRYSFFSNISYVYILIAQHCKVSANKKRVAEVISFIGSTSVGKRQASSYKELFFR